MKVRRQTHCLALGIVAAGVSAIVGMTPALAVAKPGGTGSASCPNGSAGLKTDHDVQALASTSGKTTTYTLVSNDQGAVGGVPGLISYCVYPSGASAAPTVQVSYKDWIASTSRKPPYNFSFARPGGNATNLPFNQDNKTTEIGTAQWNGSVPGSQNIVLHVADPSLCIGSASGTCFVKPSPGPVCNAGDGNTLAAYNSMPFDVVNCAPPSWGFEANSTAEFGDAVQLAPGSGTLKSLTVDFQSYGCATSGRWYTGDCVTTTAGQTFTVPGGITARIYARNSDNTVGALLAQATVDPTIPYRPSANPTKCPDGPIGTPGSQWYNTVSGKCQYSIGTLVKFTFTSPGAIPADRNVIWTVSFNTTHVGYSPIGEATTCYNGGSAPGCGYDSLNVGTNTFPGAPYAGIDLNPDGLWVNYNTVYGSPPPLTPGLHEETGHTGETPLGEIVIG